MSEGSRPGTTSPRTAPPVTVLVMRQDEAAADSALRPGLAGSEAAADAEDEAGEDDADLLDTSDPAGGGESAASPEELEDEDAEGGGAARRRGSKTCTYEGCRETTSQVAKQRKPWMCKKHRNKMYKDKYKKKKSDQAQGSGGPAAASTGNVKLEHRKHTLHCQTENGIFWGSPCKTYSIRASVKSEKTVITKKSRSCPVFTETAAATQSTSFGAKTAAVPRSSSVRAYQEVCCALPD